MHRIYMQITNKFNSFILVMTYDDFKLSIRNITKGVVTLGLQEGGNSLGQRSGGKTAKIKYHVLNQIHRTPPAPGRIGWR